MIAAARRPFVLVADDDRDTRELYRACFDTSGYRTAEVATGSQAIVVAVDIIPDVLLTDYVLPDIDGLSMARRLKDDGRTAAIRILMVTGYATPNLDHLAAAAGIERVFLKPALPEMVLREVSRALERPVMQRRPLGMAFAAAAPQAQRRVGLDRRDLHARAGAIARVRDEFTALPGLTLTAAQARLVFDLERDATERIFESLVAEGFLSRAPNGAYRRERRSSSV